MKKIFFSIGSSVQKFILTVYLKNGISYTFQIWYEGRKGSFRLTYIQSVLEQQ